MVRSLVNVRKKLHHSARDLSDEQLNIKLYPGQRSPGEVLRYIALIQDFVINKMLLPLIEGNEPQEFDSYEQVKPANGLSMSALKDALLTAQEDAVVFIREHSGNLRGLPRLKHPRLGRMSPKTWLYFLYLHELKHIKQLKVM